MHQTSETGKEDFIQNYCSRRERETGRETRNSTLLKQKAGEFSKWSNELEEKYWLDSRENLVSDEAMSVCQLVLIKVKALPSHGDWETEAGSPYIISFQRDNSSLSRKHSWDVKLARGLEKIYISKRQNDL